ncbi:hypothetical protein M0804_011471 [Polistes exclamans]|nr:hypothetical protein M0804_011471 [Polistes exclamans]
MIVEARSEARLVLCPTGIQRTGSSLAKAFVRELMAEPGARRKHYFAGKATRQEIMVHSCQGTLLFLLKLILDVKIDETEEFLDDSRKGKTR